MAGNAVPLADPIANGRYRTFNGTIRRLTPVKESGLWYINNVLFTDNLAQTQQLKINALDELTFL